MTKRAFILGHPIAHSMSPRIHGHWLKTHGIDGSYTAFDVAPEAFESTLRELHRDGFVGGNVTIPHKEAAARASRALSERAARIGAVNTLIAAGDGFEGDNTDAPGFCENLIASVGRDRLGDTALVLGAGGTSRAVVTGLVELGFRRILIANRTASRTDAIIALAPAIVRNLAWPSWSTAASDVDLLVNTTSIGMHASAEPETIDLGACSERTVVADVVYNPLETPFLAAARRRGLGTVDGLGMLLHQAVPGFEAWFGTRPEVTPELRALVIEALNSPKS